MRVRRGSLRKGLIALGCLVGTVKVPAALVGGLFIFCGCLLHLWSKGCLEQNLRLTTSGPYRFSRNPFYLANLSIDLGLCFVIGRPWIGVAYFILWAVAYRDTIAQEEVRLEALFPGEFPEYRESVPVLIPTGRRWPEGRATGGFDFGNAALARGAEYARLLGIAMAPGVIWASEVLRRERWTVFDDDHSLILAWMLFLAVLWVGKLGLAETFRRPETTLLPFATHPVVRLTVALVLAGCAIVVGEPWAMNLPLLWVLLLGLDRVGESLFARRAGEGRYALARRPWPYSSTIAIGAILIFSGINVLKHWPPA